MTHLIISATTGDSFRRCGQSWPKSGRVVDASDLGDKDLARLKAEPMLHVREATPVEIRDAGQADSAPDERLAQIAEAITGLEVDDFQADGKPRLDSLKALLGDEFGKITGAERDAAWKAVQANGFEAPTAAS